MKYAIYKIDSGEILRLVICPESMVEMQLTEGESFVLCEVSGITGTTHRVINGMVTALPPLPPPPPPTEAEIRAILTGLAQRHLDSFARSWGYDDIRSACTYVGDPYARFAAEGLALRNWRSAVWSWLDAAQAQPLPDPIPTQAEFIAMLPAVPARPVG